MRPVGQVMHLLVTVRSNVGLGLAFPLITIER
jgi:hypothetical protein